MKWGAYMANDKKPSWIDEKSAHILNEYHEFAEIKKKIQPERESFRISMIYLVIGSAWILLSDKLAAFLSNSDKVFKAISLYKGWFYVLATGIIFYFIIFRALNLYRKSIDYVLKSYTEVDDAYEELMSMNEELAGQYNEVDNKKNALQISEQRYQLIVEGATDGIWDWDLVKDVYFVSEKWKKLFGYATDEIGSTIYSWEKLFFPGDWETTKVILDEFTSGGKEFYEATYRLRKKSGEYRWIYSRGKAVRDENGTALRMAGSHTDITDRKTMEYRLESLAYYDALTGLPNRIFFEQEVQICMEEKKDLAIINLDIDDLKHINDMYGQETGDRYIKHISKILENSINKSDIAARLGGDQFAIMCYGNEKEREITAKMDYILSQVRTIWVVAEGSMQISVSAGIALYPDNGTQFSSLMQNAEIAMFRHKNKGKDGYTFFHPAMYEETLKTIQMNTRLREAVEKHQFLLYYQPQIDLASNEIVGVEALIRWIHPKEGFIPPMSFIPISEKNGLIIPISRWTLETAIRQTRKWSETGKIPVKIAVNMSGNIITDDTALDGICAMIEEMEVKPGEIEIEVTETAVMIDLEKAKESLERLRTYGITIAMDDFGTGYSSLTYLQKLPLDYLKIDREFIANIKKEDENSFIYKAVIDLAHNMNIQVVAEGIETKEQREFLIRNGCDIGQGYYFAKPMTASELEPMLLTSRI